MSLINKIVDYPSCTIIWDEVWKIPEFKKLQTTEQNPYWHGEIYVSRHIEQVVNEIYKLCPIETSDVFMSVGDGSVRWQKRFYLMLAALFHDIGKGVTTKWNDEEQTWKSPHHAKVGEQITRKLLWDEDFTLREIVCSLVGNHMKPLYIYDSDNPIHRVIRLSEELVPFEWLLTLKTADCQGSIIKEYDGWREKLDYAKEIAVKYECLNKQYTFLNDYCRHKYFNENIEYPVIDIVDKDFNDDFCVYFMIGIPGSGKTTYRNTNLSNLPVVCRDEIRTEIGIKGEKPKGTKKQEDEVTNIQNERIFKYARQKQSFIIDATNLKLMYRDKFRQMLYPYKPKIVYVYIEAPTYNETLTRRKGQIPKDVINKMRESFEFPKLYECDELIIEKQCNNISID